MARIIQGTSSAGYGGLEMVIHDFHAWLIAEGHDATVFAAEGTAFHHSLVASGFAKSLRVFSAQNFTKEFKKEMADELANPEASFLFHSHGVLKSFAFSKPRAHISMLSHTFYKSKKRDLWHRYLFSKVDQWIALSQLHKQNMLDLLGLDSSKIKIIPNGVNLEKFRIVQRNSRFTDEVHIAIVARLDPQKGQDVALMALAKIKKRTAKKVFLHLYGNETPGEKSIRPQLEILAEKLRVEEQVIFEGFDQNIAAALARTDVLWMPSFRETFGRCLIEAMACGVPIVASRAGGVPDIIHHKKNGMLFETQNSDDLVEQTLFVIENPFAREAMRGQALRDVHENYDLDKVFRNLLESILPRALPSRTDRKLEDSEIKSQAKPPHAKSRETQKYSESDSVF